VLEYANYGKRTIVDYKCSPDALVQLVLLTAYLRLYGDVPNMYEPCQTKHFHLGRTEAVRTTSEESLAFAEALNAMHRRESRMGGARVGSMNSSGCSSNASLSPAAVSTALSSENSESTSNDSTFTLTGEQVSDIHKLFKDATARHRTRVCAGLTGMSPERHLFALKSMWALDNSKTLNRRLSVAPMDDSEKQPRPLVPSIFRHRAWAALGTADIR
jgi:hypothetical protein